MNDADALPAAFVGHGNPMNTLEHNAWTEAWHDLARSFPRPRAILAVSAHWYVNATVVTGMEHPPTIHDFYGFPDQLFAVQYPAPGSPALAAEVTELVAPTWVGIDRDSWGLDHGTWSILAHMYPEADVPVVQLSIDATKSPAEHVALGAALEPLRRRGVLVLASGNVVHNLRMVQWGRPDAVFDWAAEFDDAARLLMATRPGDVTELVDHPAYALAAPTPDHLVPLYYLAGLAAAAGTNAEAFVTGHTMGSLTMTGYVVR